MADYYVETNEYNPIVLFFDEMHLLQSEKKRRIKTAETFAKKAQQFLSGVYADIKAGRFLHEKADNEYVDDLIALYIAMVESVDKTVVYDTDVNAKASRFANQVQATNRRAIEGYSSPDEMAFSNAMLLGNPIAEELIPPYVGYKFLPDEYDGGYNWRAMEIGMYETNWIYNYQRHKEKVESGQTTHTWETMRDEKVRGSHAVADGQTVLINEPFIVGGYRMMFPCDDSMGAPPNETMGCRCLEL